MRERVAFMILVTVLIFLFAFTFAVLVRGHYDPAEGRSAVLQASSSVPA